MKINIEFSYSKQSAKFLSKYQNKITEDQVEMLLLKA